MKPILFVVLLVIAGTAKSYGQAQELEQLALDIEKLAQFKQMLTDLKTAYQVLEGGYNTIKNISEGNFDLHKTFLDGLLAVSPAVQKYKKIAAIISLQLQLVKEYKAAKTHFGSGGQFSFDEFNYISGVYERLVSGSLNDLDALLNVVTANKLRMSDDERIRAIDKIFDGMQGRLVFLRQFNSSTSVLGIQRRKEQNDIDISRRLYDIK